MLSEFDRRAIAADLAEVLAAQSKKIADDLISRTAVLLDDRSVIPQRPVFNLKESARYVGKVSYKSFDAWARLFHVPRCGRGRFARRQLDLGMEREARATYQHGKGLVA